MPLLRSQTVPDHCLLTCLRSLMELELPHAQGSGKQLRTRQAVCADDRSGDDTQTETEGMKAYLITTGTVFALITMAHIFRMFVEGSHLVKEPVFLLLTLLAATLSFWAWCLLARSSRSGKPHY